VPNPRPTRPTPSAPEAIFCAAIQAEGDYGHVTVRSHRGYLYIHASDDVPVARLTPLADHTYGLSFHHHTGRWEPMPFQGDLLQLAKTLVSTLGPYLHRAEGFSPRPRISGSDI
jgi:hypothetical protein